MEYDKKSPNLLQCKSTNLKARAPERWEKRFGFVAQLPLRSTLVGKKHVRRFFLTSPRNFKLERKKMQGNFVLYNNKN
jgi:hypothetical protein